MQPLTKRIKFRPMPRHRAQEQRISSMRGAVLARNPPVSRSIASASRWAYFAPVYANVIIARTMRVQSNLKL